MPLPITAEPAPLTADPQGVVKVGGTRVTLDTVVYAFQEGASAEEIVCRYPALELADVYATITYYLRHRGAVETYLSERDERAEGIRQQNEMHFPPSGVASVW